MLLVLMHHSGMPGRMWIIAFYMPFFFIISGYTESLKNHSISSNNLLVLIKSRFKRLIIPYFAFELLNFFIYSIWRILSHKSFHPISYFVRIVLCLNDSSDNGELSRLWFLPCLFVSDILFYLIIKFVKQKPALLVTSGSLFIVSYFITKHFGFRFPFTIDIALIATAFLILGYFDVN